ncbi:hypothetical protein HD597_010965 [Nonomuraea thailandensis]|uniref:Esterase-like activity of phytase family protein n=1 Tax=Nonomuraea thailandensis TaxID=1188745 RepID=A0A9X2GTX8_9ACTN|nr:hypothetical protein [Nonomuraea thailandensis]MCP2363945.1 hypothetical protein [Nonomuraea thailandensis]
MGDFVTRMLVVAAVCLLPAVPASQGPAFAAAPADDGTEKLFTFRDQRITESSGLAVSPTHDGLYYTHNDSAAAPTFYAVDGEGRTLATFQVRGAQARDWEAMAATKDPRTGRGVLWFADIGDNLDGAWPNVSVYKVLEPRTIADATLPATRYRFRYADGARNAEGLMVHPRTGRLYVVSKEFSGSVYAAPQKLRTDRVNVLRKVASAPLMATDAAYAPDGSSYVVRTYFSATLYRSSGETIGRVTMPELEQAESIAYTADGRSLLVGSEGPRSPVYRVPLPAGSTPTPSPVRAEQDKEPAPVARAGESDGAGLTLRDVLIWLAAAVAAIGVITFLARRTR